jgi:hypothetical protein
MGGLLESRISAKHGSGGKGHWTLRVIVLSVYAHVVSGNRRDAELFAALIKGRNTTARSRNIRAASPGLNNRQGAIFTCVDVVSEVGPRPLGYVFGTGADAWLSM